MDDLIKRLRGLIESDTPAHDKLRAADALESQAAKIERLKERLQPTGEVKSNKAWRVECEATRQQLAESQAREAKLREALKYGAKTLTDSIIKFGNSQAMQEVISKNKSAISLPSDDTALKEWFKEQIGEPVAYLHRFEKGTALSFFGESSNHVSKRDWIGFITLYAIKQEAK